MEVKEQEPFVQRMIEEHKELKDKLTKLNVFIGSRKFAELDDYQKSLLVR